MKAGMKAKFALGHVVATPGALGVMAVNDINPADLLARHTSGDWGELCREDKRTNDRAVKAGFRIMSSYPVGDERIWVITEADRSATTFLLPEEY